MFCRSAVPQSRTEVFTMRWTWFKRTSSLRSPERGTFKPEVETLEQRALLNSGWAFDPFYSPSMATTPVATGDPSTSVFAQSQSGGLTMGTDSSSILGDPYFAQSPFSNFDPSGWLSNN